MTNEDIFNDAIKHFDDPDSAKEFMVKEGIPFKSVTRLYNNLMIKNGLAFDKETKSRLVSKALLGKRLNSKRAFEGRSKAVLKALKNTVTTRSADALVRAFAKRHEVECWQRPYREEAVRVSFMKKFCNFLEENPFVKEKDVVKYLDKGTATYIKRNRNAYMDVWRMVSVIIRKHDNGA